MRRRDSSGGQLPSLGHVHTAGERQIQKWLAEVHRCRGRESSKGKADWNRIDGAIAHRVSHCDGHRNTDLHFDANCHWHLRPICHGDLDLDFGLNRNRDLDSHRNLHGNVDGNFNSDRIADAHSDRDRNPNHELDQDRVAHRVDDSNCRQIRDRNRVDDDNRDHIRNRNFDRESDAIGNRHRDDNRDSDSDRNRDAHDNRDLNRVGDADCDRHPNLQCRLRHFVEFQR